MIKVPLLGAHISIAGGITKALLRGNKLGCSTIQIFTKNSNQWKERIFEASEVAAFRELRKRVQIDSIIAHNSFLINLATPDKELYQKSINSMFQEMERCQLLEIRGLVFHPGSHRGKGEKYGIKKIANALNLLHQKTEKYGVKIMIENTAGQGNSIGYRLEQIAQIIDEVEDKSRIAICIDTCHAFAAGYEINTEEGYKIFFNKIDELIGIDKVGVLHLNDSKNDCGSRLDRHEDIGKGKIGEMPFRWIMQDKLLTDVPKIIETPGLKKVDVLDRDEKNLCLLRSFI